MAETEAGAVPAAQKSSYMSFVKQLASMTGDLSSMSAPSFILSPQSLIEFSAYWMEPNVEFAAISSGKTPEERMVLVTKYFIATLKGQYTRRETQTGSEKKPLNPILLEQFFASIPDAAVGDTILKSEQVSHHPPITAYHIENAKAGVSLQGHCGQKTSFAGKSLTVRQVGHALLRVVTPEKSVETYLITLPRLDILGLFFGAPYVELAESSYIQASTGFHTKIEYKAAGYIKGKAHRFVASISANPKATAKYVVEGQWTETSKYSKGSLQHEGDVFVDATQAKADITVKPISEQGTLESRKVWKDVADGIRSGDFESASAAKSKLENEQRAKRKQEKETGVSHQLSYFTHVEDDADYRKLAGMFNHTPAHEESYHLKS